MVSAMDTLRCLMSGRGLFNNICDLIIRPERSVYDPTTDLGPEMFRLDPSDPQRYKRTDLTIENMRGLNLQCSWFRPLYGERRPCVVYIHGNCGSRYDALEALFLLREGYSLFCFDAAGSGVSDGEYISLGFYERQDLAAVVDFLSSQKDVNGIGLWGRSMGAVTSIMYASKDDSIKCIVCDSPFSTLRSLVNDLVKRHVSMRFPSSLINRIVNRMRKRIAKRAAFNIDDLDTLKYASECAVPAFIFHGSEDDFVAPQNSIDVSDRFKGPCLHHLVSGGHNDERDEDVRSTITNFFSLHLVLKAEKRAATTNATQRDESRVAEEYTSQVGADGAMSSPSHSDISREQTAEGEASEKDEVAVKEAVEEVDDDAPDSGAEVLVESEGEDEGYEEVGEDLTHNRQLSASLAPVKVTKPCFYDPDDMSSGDAGCRKGME